jgi:hypothetical protein
MAMSPLHTKVRALIARGAFGDERDPESLADAGRTLAALIRRRVIFVEPDGRGSLADDPAMRRELQMIVRRAYHDGCRRLGPSGAHTLEACDESGRRMHNETADAVFEAVAPYLGRRRKA